MVLEHNLLERIILHIQGLNYGEGVYESKGHVGEEALNSKLSLKLGAVKTIPLVGFPTRMLENV